MSLPVRLSAAIMTHPARRARALALRDGLPELSLQVVEDPDPYGPGSCSARTAVLAWGAMAPEATHHLVLQDDAVPVPDLRERVLRAVGERPAAAISLYTEWASATSSAVHLAAWLGQPFAEVCDPYTPCIGLVLPAEAARELARTTPEVPQDDVMIADVLRRLGVPAYVTVPHLVQHATEMSLTGNTPMGLRLAACYTTEPHGDTSPVVDARVDLLPCFSRSYGRPYYLERNPDSAFGWSQSGLLDVMRRRDVDVPALQRTAARRAAGLHRAEPDLRPDIVISLWITAWLGGVELRRLLDDQAVVPAQVLDRRLGQIALANIGPGIFDQYLLPERLLELSPVLETFAREAFAEGVTPSGSREAQLLPDARSSGS
ncbi:hypothetical protein [Streptomyces sp. NPDC059076]|uniref:hypothetical protein n=2 Tax=Streptomyces TaxID=1883 RepID=UPI0036A08708